VHINQSVHVIVTEQSRARTHEIIMCISMQSNGYVTRKELEKIDREMIVIVRKRMWVG
jgi:hypothetical protein